MKKLLVASILLFNLSIYSKTPEIGDIVKFTKPIKVKKVHQFTEANGTNDESYLKANVLFTVVSIDATVAKEVELQAIPFSPVRAKKRERMLEKKGFIYNSELYNNKIYKIDYSDFNDYAVIGELNGTNENDRLSIGILTLPFKARPQSPNDLRFDTEFNLNTTLNFRVWNFGNARFNLQGGAGLGSIGLDPSNADGIEETGSLDAGILSFLGGAMIQYKNVQFGAYFGVDYINNNITYKWNHNGDVWFGVGIGYSIFNISIPNKSNTQ
ncbi:hypothetical protein [Aquimarina pacifica]|uniref:hypothetical protein n=1 Tax=Aquimarina pacifica TaxID=1296415 RepID=UPI00046E562D|nr:hypothetical protein [Aquimarina pacifica]